MFYEVLREKRASQEKIAVTMADLRRAYKARVKPHLVRPPKNERRFFRQLAQANEGTAAGQGLQGLRLQMAALTLPKEMIESQSATDAYNAGINMAKQFKQHGVKPRYKSQLDPVDVALRTQKNLAATQAKLKNVPDSKLFIRQGGDTSRLFGEAGPSLGLSMPRSRTPEAREAFNRTVGLHEAAEMTASRRSPSRGFRPTFESHQGPQPMLNDVIIANTFKGKGAKEFKAQVGAMRKKELGNLKLHLSSDPRSVELIEKLESGGRINRHQRKYLDRQYAKIALGR
ncbi:MAG: hypothetical protein VXZ72_02310 [Chlamydiota bacterium]|nr:hypothetical protein [Chlamydiota bacterium]